MHGRSGEGAGGGALWGWLDGGLFGGEGVCWGPFGVWGGGGRRGVEAGATATRLQRLARTWRGLDCVACCEVCEEMGREGDWRGAGDRSFENYWSKTLPSLQQHRSIPFSDLDKPHTRRVWT